MLKHSTRTMAALRLGGMLIVAGVLFVVPTDVLSAVPSICLFRNFFGVECLGCGMVRAASCLLHGHLAEAAAFNRLVFAALPLAALLALRDIRSVVRSRVK